MEEVENNGTKATAQALVASEGAVRGRIAPIADIDMYSVTLAQNERLIAFTVVSSAGNASTDTNLRILTSDPSTDVLITDNDNGTFPTNSSIVGIVQATTAGTYYIEVTENGNDDLIRPYVLVWKRFTASTTAESEANNDIASADAFVNDFMAGNAGSADIDTFELTVPAGGTLVAFLDDDDDETSTAADDAFDFNNARLTVRNAANDSLMVTGNGQNAKYVTYTTTAAGNYYVQVDRSGGGGVDYRLVGFVLPAATETCTAYAGSAISPADDTSANGTVNVTQTGFITNLRLELDVSAASSNTIDIDLQAPQGGAGLVNIWNGVTDMADTTLHVMITDDALVSINDTWDGGGNWFIDNTEAKPEGARRMHAAELNV